MTWIEEGFFRQTDWIQLIDINNISQSINFVARGLVKLELEQGEIEVKDVSGTIQNLTKKLHSISKICDKNMTVLFKADGCEVRDEDGNIVVADTQENDMYLQAESEATRKSLIDEQYQFVVLVQQQTALHTFRVSTQEALFSSSSSRVENPLDLVYSDVCGPI